MEKINVGTIFSYSWGYDQTNYNFFQVVRKTKKSIYIREIEQKKTESDLLMQGKTIPIKDKFQEGGLWEGKTLLKRPYEWNNRIYVNIESYGSCHIWEGKLENYTSYA
jgi:hypothetical protein